MIAAWIAASLLAAAPDFSQGVEISPQDGDSSGTVYIRGTPDEKCRLGRTDQSCFFDLPPGPAEVVINGHGYRIQVSRGLNSFTFAKRDAAAWLFSAGWLSCLGGGPVTMAGLIGMFVFAGSSGMAVAAVVVLVGVVAVVASLPLMIAGLVTSPGELRKADRTDRYIAAARHPLRAAQAIAGHAAVANTATRRDS